MDNKNFKNKKIIGKPNLNKKTKKKKLLNYVKIHDELMYLIT